MAKKATTPSPADIMQTVGMLTQTNFAALNLGYDIENRIIYIFGEIDRMAAYRFIAGFKWLDRTPGPIHVVLCSEGGSVDSGIAMYECIRTANNPVLVEGTGTVASAAVMVLLAGTVRLLNPETSVMIHNTSYDIEGHLTTPIVKALAEDCRMGNERMYEIYAQRTGRSIEDIRKWCDAETTFTPEDAIKHGFADKIADQRAFPKSFEDGVAQLQGAAVAEMIVAPEIQVEKPKKAKKTKKAKK